MVILVYTSHNGIGQTSSGCIDGDLLTQFETPPGCIEGDLLVRVDRFHCSLFSSQL